MLLYRLSAAAMLFGQLLWQTQAFSPQPLLSADPIASDRNAFDLFCRTFTKHLQSNCFREHPANAEMLAKVYHVACTYHAPSLSGALCFADLFDPAGIYHQLFACRIAGRKFECDNLFKLLLLYLNAYLQICQKLSPTSRNAFLLSLTNQEANRAALLEVLGKFVGKLQGIFKPSLCIEPQVSAFACQPAQQEALLAEPTDEVQNEQLPLAGSLGKIAIKKKARLGKVKRFRKGRSALLTVFSCSRSSECLEGVLTSESVAMPIVMNAQMFASNGFKGICCNRDAFYLAMALLLLSKM